MRFYEVPDRTGGDPTRQNAILFCQVMRELAEIVDELAGDAKGSRRHEALRSTAYLLTLAARDLEKLYKATQEELDQAADMAGGMLR